MEAIDKQYIVDEHNKKIAVQIPLKRLKKLKRY